jgi:hypothetical protein
MRLWQGKWELCNITRNKEDITMSDLIMVVLVEWIMVVGGYWSVVQGQGYSASWCILFAVVAGVAAVCVGVSERANARYSKELIARIEEKLKEEHYNVTSLYKGGMDIAFMEQEDINKKGEKS